MTKLLITFPHDGASDEGADIVVITGDYGATPVKALMMAKAVFVKPVVLIAGKLELDGENVERRLAEGRRQGVKLGLHFLERGVAIVGGVRFIGMHKPDTEFILVTLEEPHDGPTVIVTYEPPPEDISAVTLTGKVARWIHYRKEARTPLVVDI